MKPSLTLFEPYEIDHIDSGGKQRIFQTIKELSKVYQINSIFLSPRNKSLFSYLLHGIPYWFSDWDMSEYRKKAANCQSDALVEFSQLLYLIDSMPTNTRKTFVSHDIATISFWRRFTTETNPMKKLIHFLRWLEIYFYERKYLPKYDRIIAVSHHDSLELKRIFKLKHVDIIENGIETINFLPKRGDDGFINLGYIGSSSHSPNQQAIQLLTKNISPELTKNNIKHKIILAGSSSINGENLTNLGPIKDLKDFYSKIDVLVAPIFSGSGTRIKILESLSYGRPVITTQVGAEGIDLVDDYLQTINPMNQNNPNEWINAIKNYKYSAPSENLKKQLSQLTWENLFKKF